MVCLAVAVLGSAGTARGATDPYSLTRPGTVYDVQTLLSMAEGGDKRAAFLLGTRYASGRDTARDDSEALRWFTQAAQAGLAEAQYNLGVMYARGRGVPRDIKQAVEWYTRAAQQGLAMAQFNLGTLYSTGSGVPRDEAKAADWLERAANKGIAQAQYNLAILYEYGRGVRLNAAKALHWYRQAEEYGYGPATARRRHLERLLELPAGMQARTAPAQQTTAPARGASRKSPPESGPTTAQAAPPEPVKVQGAASVSSPAESSETVPVAENAADNWLAALDAGHYTLQLASYVDRKAAQQFIRKLNAGAVSGIYASTKRGKRWYSVIYGDYASYRQAQAAAAKLPASFRGLKPWVRKVSLIRKELDRAQ